MDVSASSPPRNRLHRESSGEPHVLDLGRLLLGLRDAALPPEGASINATTCCGGVEIKHEKKK